MTTLFSSASHTAIELAEAQRVDNALYGDAKRRAKLGQYATPLKIARLMASLLDFSGLRPVRLLDPGMGAGVLTLACLEAFAQKRNDIENFEVTGYEIEKSAFRAVEKNVAKAIMDFGSLSHELKQVDFLKALAPSQSFTHAIINPPYKKFASTDERQTALRNNGIHAVNLYVAFVWKALLELQPEGQLVAIIPRSFANGTYYLPFRQYLKEHTSVKQVLLVDERTSVFALDDVLQENVILVLRKRNDIDQVACQTKLTWLFGNDLSQNLNRSVTENQLWWDAKGACVLRLPKEHTAQDLPRYKLSDLKVRVSTGPVVDFRVDQFLIRATEPTAYPLLRPRHFAKGRCVWPNQIGKRAGGILRTTQTEKFFWPVGYYVVVRRISSKEEPRRVVASLVTPKDFETDSICFENHLNVFHHNRTGIGKELAVGLCNYLNGEITDRFLRSISGHTQVNAGDLRLLPYPSLVELQAFAKTLGCA